MYRFALKELLFISLYMCILTLKGVLFYSNMDPTCEANVHMWGRTSQCNIK